MRLQQRNGVPASVEAEPDARRARIDLDVEIRSHRISGRATFDGSPPRAFAGWLELISLLETAIANAPAGAGKR